MIQMLSMMDPESANKMKQEAKVYKLDVIRVSGPGFVTKKTLEYLQQQAAEDATNHPLILPKEYFYPISNGQRGANLTVTNYLEQVPEEWRSKVLTVHLWHASWQ